MYTKPDLSKSKVRDELIETPRITKLISPQHYNSDCDEEEEYQDNNNDNDNEEDNYSHINEEENDDSHSNKEEYIFPPNHPSSIREKVIDNPPPASIWEEDADAPISDSCSVTSSDSVPMSSLHWMITLDSSSNNISPPPTRNHHTMPT